MEEKNVVLIELTDNVSKDQIKTTLLKAMELFNEKQSQVDPSNNDLDWKSNLLVNLESGSINKHIQNLNILVNQLD